MNKGERNGKLLSNRTKNSNDIGTFFILTMLFSYCIGSTLKITQFLEEL